MTKSKILDQIKYVSGGDTAFSHLGFESGIFIAIGGTADTDIKVQHCDTLNGTFEDFALLVDGDDAGDTTDVGIALSLVDAKKYIKVVGATTCSVILGDGIENPPKED